MPKFLGNLRLSSRQTNVYEMLLIKTEWVKWVASQKWVTFCWKTCWVDLKDSIINLLNIINTPMVTKLYYIGYNLTVDKHFGVLCI